MAETLDDLKDRLYRAFEHALERADYYSSSASGPEYLKAAAQITNSIVGIEKMQDERKEEKNGLKLPGK